VSKRSARSRSR